MPCLRYATRVVTRLVAVTTSWTTMVPTTAAAKTAKTTQTAKVSPTQSDDGSGDAKEHADQDTSVIVVAGIAVVGMGILVGLALLARMRVIRQSRRAAAKVHPEPPDAGPRLHGEGPGAGDGAAADEQVGLPIVWGTRPSRRISVAEAPSSYVDQGPLGLVRCPAANTSARKAARPVDHSSGAPPTSRGSVRSARSVRSGKIMPTPTAMPAVKTKAKPSTAREKRRVVAGDQARVTPV